VVSFASPCRYGRANYIFREGFALPSEIAVEARPRPRPFYRNLTVQVLIAILLGGVLGALNPVLGKQLQPLATMSVGSAARP
jgi:hypothetical protein